MTETRSLSLNEFSVEHLETRVEMQMLGLGIDPGITVFSDGSTRIDIFVFSDGSVLVV